MASSGDKLVYFLIGSFVGACVALLLAPQSGDETRELLEGKAEGAPTRSAGSSGKAEKCWRRRAATLPAGPVRP